MADLLAGDTDHAHFAPLSHAQSLAMGRHLQEQIKQNLMLIEELQSQQLESSIKIEKLADLAAAEGQKTIQLEEDMNVAKAAVESNRKELGRSATMSQKMQQDIEQNQAGISSLRDGQKVTNAGLQKVAQDLGETTRQSNRLQEDIERRIDAAIAQLTSELSKTQLDLSHLRTDEEGVKARLAEECEIQRDTIFKQKQLADALAETNTMVGIIETRLADTINTVKGIKVNFEDLNSVVVTLHEDIDRSATQLADCQAAVRKVMNHVNQVHEQLENAIAGLAGTGQKIVELFERVDSLRLNLEDTNTTLQALEQGHGKTTQILQHVRNDLVEVTKTTQAVKAGLKEQSSLLLPNIHMDSPDARTASARHGSLLHTGLSGFGGSPTGKKPTPGLGGSGGPRSPLSTAWA